MTKPKGEQWRAVPAFEGLYEVSDQWRVWSFPRKGTRGGTLRLQQNPDGYLTVTLTKDGKSSTLLVHAIVAGAFLGPRPEGLQVCHNDGIKGHCAPGNLRYDTNSANHLDQVRHGSHPHANKPCCPKCGGPYEVLADGRRICRPCRKAGSRAPRLAWKSANPERISEYNKRYREGHREQLRAADRARHARARNAKLTDPPQHQGPMSA